jgi:hypothetical protein
MPKHAEVYRIPEFEKFWDFLEYDAGYDPMPKFTF